MNIKYSLFHHQKHGGPSVGQLHKLLLVHPWGGKEGAALRLHQVSVVTELIAVQEEPEAGAGVGVAGAGAGVGVAGVGASQG